MNRVGAVAILAAASLILGACDNVLEVEVPSRIIASDLENPAAAATLTESVVNEFRCTLTYYVNASAITGMEYELAENNVTALVWDSRVHTTGGFTGQYAQADCGSGIAALYLPLSRTRALGDWVLGLLDGFSDGEVADRSEKIGTVAAFTGYTYVLFGESMCSMAFDSGPEQTPDDAFNLGVDLFDRAIAEAGIAGRDDLVNLARVGKARALLNLGQPAEAGSVAAAVPPGFSYEMPYSGQSGVTWNRQFVVVHRNQIFTVGETFRGMSFGGEPDPRVSLTDLGITGQGSDVQIIAPDKYDQIDSPIQLASWEEAQLIMAEAALAAGATQDAVDIINVLHANVGLPAFSSDDANEIRDQIVYERMAELFLEGHHLMDIKRLNIPLVPAPGTEIPFGGQYGDMTCFRLPDVERLNNPNIPNVG